ncbi:hypothetical protein AALH30_20810 [Blautia pseudococcoides]|nr:hypothetical protein [Blautia pseudococcoides]MCR2023487.1 hypothetical protein [Blautia pseudococcoides]QJU15625.1 hypothetical protein HL650_14960 [Blautia pseudococcoides]
MQMIGGGLRITACPIRMGGFFVMRESRPDVHAGKGCPIGPAMTRS